MHPVDHQVQVDVVGIDVQAVEHLMAGQLHLVQKQIDRFLDLGGRRLLARAPAQHVVADRVLAVRRYLCQPQHLRFLGGALGREKAARPAVDALLPGRAGVRSLRVIGQPRHPPGFGVVPLVRLICWRMTFRAVDVVGQSMNADGQRAGFAWIANLLTDHFNYLNTVY